MKVAILVVAVAASSSDRGVWFRSGRYRIAKGVACRLL